MISPFSVLGLPGSSELTDDDVRSAWRRIAADTHPDRQDGGDPATFAAAAAAYTQLRTAAGRGEALADIAAGDGRVSGGPVPGKNWLAAAAASIRWRISRGRRARLAARLLIAATAGAIAVAAVSWQPASAAIITGALTWLLLTCRHDLASPR